MTRRIWLSSPTLGFIGVGTIAAALVRGLRLKRPSLTILLSPRSEGIGAELAAENPNVNRVCSNAAVVEASDIIVLAMRPPQFKNAVAGLSFREDQVVVSCLAATGVDEIATAVAPALVCRMIPLPMNQRAAGPLALYSAPPEVVDLFDALGDMIVARSEAEFGAYSAASATMSTFFALQATAINWLERQGAPAASAETYVRSMQKALAETAADRRGGWRDLVTDYETRGGINERVRLTLERGGWFDALGTALEGLGTVKGIDLEHVTQRGGLSLPDNGLPGRTGN